MSTSHKVATVFMIVFSIVCLGRAAWNVFLIERDYRKHRRGKGA